MGINGIFSQIEVILINMFLATQIPMIHYNIGINVSNTVKNWEFAFSTQNDHSLFDYNFDKSLRNHQYIKCEFYRNTTKCCKKNAWNIIYNPINIE